MKNIIKSIGQLHANLIIKKMERSETLEDLNYWYNRGLQINNFFLSLDINLD